MEHSFRAPTLRPHPWRSIGRRMIRATAIVKVCLAVDLASGLLAAITSPSRGGPVPARRERRGPHGVTVRACRRRVEGAEPAGEHPSAGVTSIAAINGSANDST